MFSLLLALTVTQTPAPTPESRALTRIAEGIERLAPKYRQLADFKAATALAPGSTAISYSFHTHRAEHRGGWSSGVPNPDDDGVWFFIDIHDRDSQAQRHTQPVTVELRFGTKAVTFLILEGAKTSSLVPDLNRILKEAGVTRPSAP